MRVNTRNKVDFVSIKKQILHELSKGDRFASELKDVTGVSYRTLWTAIAQLEANGEIKRYFRDTSPSATLCFTVSRVEKKPLIDWWIKRHEGKQCS